MARKGLTKESIIACAMDILKKNGIEGVTLAAIAKELGIQPPSLYNHISGLTEIKDMIAFEGLNQLLAALESAVKNRDGDEAILSFSYAYMKFVEINPYLYEVTIIPPSTNEEAKTVSNKIVAIGYSLFKEYLLDEQEVIHALRGLRSILHGFSTIKENEGFGLPVDLYESFDYSIHAYLRGLKERRRSLTRKNISDNIISNLK